MFIYFLTLIYVFWTNFPRIKMSNITEWATLNTHLSHSNSLSKGKAWVYFGRWEVVIVFIWLPFLLSFLPWLKFIQHLPLFFCIKFNYHLDFLTLYFVSNLPQTLLQRAPSNILHFLLCIYNKETLVKIWQLFGYFEVVISIIENYLIFWGDLEKWQACLFFFLEKNTIQEASSEPSETIVKVIQVSLKWAMIISVKSPNWAQMVIFKIHTDLVIIKNDKALDKVFVVTMLPTFNEEILAWTISIWEIEQICREEKCWLMTLRGTLLFFKNKPRDLRSKNKLYFDVK